MKTYRNIKISILILLFSLKIFAQGGNSFEIQKNSKDVSNVDIARGVPNISVPLLNLPTQSSKLNVSIGLSYSTANISNQQMISEVGLGWNISSGGSVSRVIQNYVQDYEFKTVNNKAQLNSNVYQYNFYKGSGKFTIIYDKATHAPKVLQAETSKNKILFEKNTDTTQYKIKSFTIIDEDGLKYIFDKSDISFYGMGNKKEVYHSSFNLSTVKDENNNILLTYEYVPYTQKINDYRGDNYLVTNKLIKINVSNIGSIEYDYFQGTAPLPVTNWNTWSNDYDPYQLKKVILKDLSSQIISQYTFDNVFDRRKLQSVEKQDKNNTVLERYSFEYNSSPYSSYNGNFDKYGYPNDFVACNLNYDRLYTKESVNRLTSSIDALKAIHLPTGGKVEYEFESNTTSSNMGECYTNLYDHCFDDYKLEKIAVIDFDLSITRNYSFFKDPNIYTGKIYITEEGLEVPELQMQLLPPGGGGGFVPLTYQITSGTNIFETYPYKDHSTGNECSGIDFTIANNPTGSFNFKINGGVSSNKGKFFIYALEKQPDAIKYVKGLRIKSIKKYENEGATPTEVLNYNYSDFSQTGVPSSNFYQWNNGMGGMLDGELYTLGEEVMYQNVKVTDSIKSFSTRYTFLSPYDAQTQFALQLGNTLNNLDLNYNLFSTFLPLKVEQYDSDNNLIEKNQHTYVVNFKNIDVDNQATQLRLPWISKQILSTERFLGNNIIMTSQSETTSEGDYGNLLSEKEVDNSGNVTEIIYRYATDMNNQKLINANIIGIPIMTETKIIKNSIPKNISKSEIKFDNPATIYPSSTVAYNVIENSPVLQGTFNKYDTYGNLLQYTNQSGVPVTFVLGYKNTKIIAKIEGITYDQLQALNITSVIVTASDSDAVNPSAEPALITALDNFRKTAGLKGYYISTYTYDPLIGMTSETGPMGNKKLYTYNSAGKLEKITDGNNITIQEYKNNLKN
ncbi:hypothetical protein SD427_12650 [Chryseobacterium sp. JJR-5R]|uniref:hypothetical protein n=1 Tax=Chryseobacterium sp. JJR-5R TaxID=3093923 RepID=UPI002A750E68|nr:hypothetical protein [Chryseobacterium sp. JJR-5R]WPO81613.1 hypothetical protein SD427_12650 [Chryseobacterium sp. JJR-5R]